MVRCLASKPGPLTPVPPRVWCLRAAAGRLPEVWHHPPPLMVRTLHGSMRAHLECGASTPARLEFGLAALPATTSTHRRRPQAPVPRPSKPDPERSLELFLWIPLAEEVGIHRYSKKKKKKLYASISLFPFKDSWMVLFSLPRSECAVILICSYISFEGSLRVSCSSFVQFALTGFDKRPVWSDWTCQNHRCKYAFLCEKW